MRRSHLKDILQIKPEMIVFKMLFKMLPVYNITPSDTGGGMEVTTCEGMKGG